MDLYQSTGGVEDVAAQLVSHIATTLSPLGPVDAVGSDPEELLAGLTVVSRAVNVLESYRLGLTGRLERLPSVSETGVEVISGYDMAVAEISAAQSMTTAAAGRQVDLARDVTACLPLVLAGMRVGDLDVARARTFVDELVNLGEDNGTSLITPEVRAEVEEAMVPLAPGLTTAQLRARLRAETARRIAAARRTTKGRGRKQAVHTSDLPGLEGLGELHAVLPADAVALAEQTIDAMALALTRPDITALPEGLAQARPIRAPGQSEGAYRYQVHQWARSEALAAVLRAVAEGRPLGEAAGCWWDPDLPEMPSRQGRQPHLNITVGLDTLTGASTEPADLEGFGLIPPDLARHLAARIAAEGGSYTLIGVDVDGMCAHVGERTRYRPTRTHRDTARATYARCTAPGCRRPARQCDVDHLVAHAEGGPTCIPNLHPLCRTHHRLKTHAGWQVRPVDGRGRRPDTTTGSGTGGTGMLEWVTRYGTRRWVQPEPIAPPAVTARERGDPPF